MRTEVFSWRLSAELKSDLEREARLKNVSTSAILEMAVREWLRNGRTDTADDGVQQKLQAEVANSVGVLAGRNPRRAETAREAIRKRLARRHAR
jgi:predicted transcriptional regulator